MYTDRELRDLNKEVYYTDPKYSDDYNYVAKPNAELKGNERNTVTAGGRDFKIIGSVDIDSNGYQGLAVAPITNDYPNGNPNDVAIISAGTTPPAPFGEGSDGITDFITALSAKLEKEGSFQTKQAEDFFLHMQNNGWTITQLSGYSQGAYMLKVGAKHKIPTTVFNGWFLYSTLTEEEIEFMKNNPELFRNYRHINDGTTKLIDGNDLGKIGDGYGSIIWLEGDSHGIADWDFDENGNVISDGKEAKMLRKEHLENYLARSIWGISALANKFKSSHGGMSSSEKIYIDSSEALLFLESAAQLMAEGLSLVVKAYEESIKDAEELWNQTIKHAQAFGVHLTDFEVIEALEAGGASHAIIVEEPVTYYEENILNAKTLAEGYNSLISEVQSGIEKLVASDQELASQISGG